MFRVRISTVVALLHLQWKATTSEGYVKYLSQTVILQLSSWGNDLLLTV